MTPRNLRAFISMLLFTLVSGFAQGQVIASGKIYDAAEHVIMPGVSVTVLHSLQGMQSDEHGRYYLHVKAGDTLQFSFIGYASRKLFVPGGSEFYSEDIYMSEQKLNLPEVNISALRSYRQDSIENRVYNEKIFNYRQKSAGSKLLGPVLSSLGIKQNYQRARHGNSLSRFQDRLMLEEQQKYIDNKFNPALVKSVTGLEQPQLGEFMKEYRPSYEFLTSSTEYEFLEAVVENCKLFLRQN